MSMRRDRKVTQQREQADGQLWRQGGGLEMDLAVTHSRRGRKVSSGPDSGEGGLLQLSVALKLLATVTHQPDILHYSVSDIFRLFTHTMRFTRLRHTEAA